jgi:type I restriction enzyme, S subunit
MPYVAHQNHVFKARKFLQEQDESWLEMFLNGPSARDYFAGSSKQTTNLASINKTQLRGCLIAIPPKNEKSYIVAKVDELMTLCDQLKSRLQTSQQTQLALAESLVEGALA